MSAQQNNRPNVFYRVLAVFLALAVSVANSVLFYFVIWDMFSPSQPFSVVLFIGSGGAHLAYFFLPWFIKEMLVPLRQEPAVGGSRSASRNGGGKRNSIEGLATVCTMFAVLLGVTATGLWLVQSQQEESNTAIITKANCEQVGGEFQLVEGKLVCVIEKTAP